MERKNAIITGGVGFIGSNLASKLLEYFDKIYLVDNLLRSNNLRNLPKNNQIEFIYGDINTFDFNKLPNVSHCFHLAATRINRCSKYNKEGHNIITNGGFNVVDYCTKNKVKLFFASTASVYHQHILNLIFFHLDYQIL